MDDSTHRPLPPWSWSRPRTDDEPTAGSSCGRARRSPVLFCYSDVEALHRLYRAGLSLGRLDLDEVAAVRAHVQTLLLDAAPGATPTGPVPVVPGQRRA